MLLRAWLIWTGILACAFINGAARELLLIPALGKSVGLVVSAALLSAVVLTIAFLSVRWIGVTNNRQAAAVGLLWLLATLAFEFGFGAGVQQKSLAELLAAYSFDEGNLWPLVLLATLAAPLLSHRLQRRG